MAQIKMLTVNLLRALLVPATLCFGCGVMASNALDVPADWVEVSAGTLFSVKAPPGTVFKPGQGKDSVIGAFEGPGFLLSFDYGVYSDPLDRDSRDQGYQARDTRVNGKAAKIVTAYARLRSPVRPYFIGIHFPDVEKSSLGSIKLTVSGSLEKKEDYSIVEKILATIRFQSKQGS